MRQTRTSPTSRRDALGPLVVSERNPPTSALRAMQAGPPFLERPAGGSGSSQTRYRLPG
jgi:hypothetical protein